MRGKKLGVIFGVLFLVMFLLAFTPLVSAAGEKCEIKPRSECTGGQYPILGLSGTSNAHGERYDQTNYPYVLCCNFGDGIQSGSECTQGTGIVKLSSTTNAHAESYSLSNYANSVCYAGGGGFTFSCQTAPAGILCEEFGANYNAVLSLSSTTNAHIGSPSDYSIKICCNVQGGVAPPPSPYTYWGDISGNQMPDITAPIGTTVYMYGGNLAEISPGLSVLLEIYEYDPFLNDPIRTLSNGKYITATADSGGKINVSWTITQPDWDAGNDGNELDDEHQEFFFIIKNDPEIEVNRSSNLIWTLPTIVGPTPVAYWSDVGGNNISEAEIQLGQNVYMKGKNLSDYDGSALFLKIYERDFPPLNPDDLIKTISVSPSGGNIDSSWQVTQADLDLTGESQEGGPDNFEEFYFRVTDQGNNPILTSNDLTLTINREILQCNFISFCSDYDQASCNADACNKGPASAPSDIDCSDPNTNCGCGWNSDLGVCDVNVTTTDQDSFCGDSEIQSPNEATPPISEECDPDDQDTGGAPVFLTGEGLCENHDSYTGGTLGCYTGGDLACQFDVTGCTGGTPMCGDNLINQPTEDCDGTALRGWDCTTFGFAGGNLGCFGPESANSCTFDLSGCDPIITGGVCGDDIQQVPNSNGFNEQCDDGNLVSGDGCSATCTDEGTTYCGDGTIQKPNDNGENEECEDGNTASGDGCSATCQNEGTGGVCGDDIQQVPNSNGFNEQCDDGNLVSGDGCSATCIDERTTYCGDSTIQTPNDNNQLEECEDGNTQNLDGCSSTCQIEDPTYCGDGLIQSPNSGGMFEQCDGSNLGSTPSCSAASDGYYTGGTLSCKSYCVYNYGACTGNTPACLNGIIDDPLNEECDSPDFGVRGNSCTYLGFESGTISCTNNCKVNTASCVEPPTQSGSCQITQDTTDDCSDGYLSFSWTGTWFGRIFEPEYSQCIEGNPTGDTIVCPVQIQLPFFSAYNIIAVIVLAILIYLIISRKKPAAKRKRHGSGKKR